MKYFVLANSSFGIFDSKFSAFDQCHTLSDLEKKLKEWQLSHAPDRQFMSERQIASYMLNSNTPSMPRTESDYNP